MTPIYSTVHDFNCPEQSSHHLNEALAVELVKPCFADDLAVQGQNAVEFHGLVAIDEQVKLSQPAGRARYPVDLDVVGFSS